MRTHQRQLRSELYNQVIDAFTRVDSERVSNANSLGRRYILPSTFQGGPRDLMENRQNSLAFSRRYGVADLFITITANPKWPEILNALLPGQTPTDRSDLVSRVFHQKKVFLIDLIVKKEVFGSTVARVHTIEFQKRGLSYMHLLIWLQREYKFTTSAEVDAIISTEFPDPQTYPRLFRLVSDVMTYGPCGEHKPDTPCMQNRHCSKHYPKEL